MGAGGHTGADNRLCTTFSFRGLRIASPNVIVFCSPELKPATASRAKAHETNYIEVAGRIAVDMCVGECWHSAPDKYFAT